MIRLGGQRCVSDQRGHLAMETQGEGCSSGEVTQDLHIANVKLIFVRFNDPLHSPHHHITKGSAIWGCSFDFEFNLCFHPGMWLAPGLSKVSLVSWLQERLTYSIVKSRYRIFFVLLNCEKRRPRKRKVLTQSTLASLLFKVSVHMDWRTARTGHLRFTQRYPPVRLWYQIVSVKLLSWLMARQAC